MRRRMGRAGARREGGRWFGREGGLSLVGIVVGVAILVIGLGGGFGLVRQSGGPFGGRRGPPRTAPPAPGRTAWISASPRTTPLISRARRTRCASSGTAGRSRWSG